MSIIKQHVDIDVSHVTTSENPAFFHRRILGRLKEDTWHPLPTRVSFAARTSFLEDFFSFASVMFVFLKGRLRLQICPLWKCAPPQICYFGCLSVAGPEKSGDSWGNLLGFGWKLFWGLFLASGTSRDPDTNSKSTWKMDGWKTIFSFWVLGLFSGAMLVLGRVPVLESRNNFVPRKNALREKQILTIT